MGGLIKVMEGENPGDIHKPPAGRRERFLSEEEIRLVWETSLRLQEYGRIIRLLLLTGCRRGEIGSLRWDEIDVAKRRISLPTSRTKTKVTHVVHLTDLMLAQLPPRRPGKPNVFGRESHGFGGWRIKYRLDGKLGGMQRWTVHDLRRTFNTHMHEHGLARHEVIEACQAHKVGGAVSKLYNHATYLGEKRTAWEAWSSWVAKTVGLANNRGSAPDAVPPSDVSGEAAEGQLSLALV